MWGLFFCTYVVHYELAGLPSTEDSADSCCIWPSTLLPVVSMSISDASESPTVPSFSRLIFSSRSANNHTLYCRHISQAEFDTSYNKIYKCILTYWSWIHFFLHFGFFELPIWVFAVMDFHPQHWCSQRLKILTIRLILWQFRPEGEQISNLVIQEIWF